MATKHRCIGLFNYGECQEVIIEIIQVWVLFPKSAVPRCMVNISIRHEIVLKILEQTTQTSFMSVNSVYLLYGKPLTGKLFLKTAVTSRLAYFKVELTRKSVVTRRLSQIYW